MSNNYDYGTYIVDDDRPTYRELRVEAIENAYNTCRGLLSLSYRGKPEDIPEIHIFAGFFDQTYECFGDILELMYRTLQLILYRGIAPEIVHAECTRIIKDILSRNSFKELSQYMSEEEVADLGKDLRLLKFID